MRKKLEHWWTYHKGIVIFAVVLAAAVLYVAGTMGKKEKTQILMGEVVNNVQDDAVTTRMEEAILAGIGGDPNGEEVVVDTALTMDAAALGQTPIADANTQDSLATITTYVYAHELDFMILEKDVFDYYCNLNAFADLRELLGAGACEALGAVKTSVYIYLVPVITVAASVLILREPFTWMTGAGTVLTLIGLLLSEGKLHWKEGTHHETGTGQMRPGD